jgi:ABC-type multidrug transport system fused ATPase/permease subunit
MLRGNGATILGAERQRTSIAIALLKDAPIIPLNEATTSLDPVKYTTMLIQDRR